jgi:hypothetical protein
LQWLKRVIELSKNSFRMQALCSATLWELVSAVE